MPFPDVNGNSGQIDNLTKKKKVQKSIRRITVYTIMNSVQSTIADGRNANEEIMKLNSLMCLLPNLPLSNLIEYSNKFISWD